MDKLILFLLIIVLILCFKNINVMVKKTDECVIKVIIVLIIIGLIFMCKDDLVEGLDNCQHETCKGNTLCWTGEACGAQTYYECNEKDGFHYCGDKLDGDKLDGDKLDGNKLDSREIIKINNSTSSTMYVFLVDTKDVNGYKDGKPPNGWMTDIEPIKVPNSPTYYYKVEKEKYLAFKTTNILNKWMSATLMITNKLPDGVFDYSGLTKYEWSFDGNNMNINISGADGLNSFGTLKIDGGNTEGAAICPENDSKSIIDCKHNKNISNNEFMVNMNNISRYMRNKVINNELQTNILSELGERSCGERGNCSECGTGPDKCGPGEPQEHGCVVENLKDRWGCYKFWSSENPEALKWKDLFDEDKGCPVYSWAYDEATMVNPDKIKPFDINCSNNLNSECTNWTKTNTFKCLFEKPDCNKNIKDESYLIDNPIAPLRVCKLNNTISVNIDIKEIL